MIKEKAVLIRGPQGSGKTTLAIKISRNRGGLVKYLLGTDCLKGRFTLGTLLYDEPATVIIEDFEPTEENLELMKPLISNDTITIEQKGAVRTPNFILCSGNKDAIPHDIKGRRYAVIDL